MKSVNDVDHDTKTNTISKAPFPWFGGKSRAAHLVWCYFTDITNYVEPFAGSLAILLARDEPVKTETVNDLDGFVANFWRAVSSDPEAVAHHADWPVNENDLHARHAWLVPRRGSLSRKLEGDPDYFDPKIAGWWVWGVCTWIGSGWCSGKGPWAPVEGELIRIPGVGQGQQKRGMPHLGDRGQGQQKRGMPHLGDRGQGINRQVPHLGDRGRGINRQMPHSGDRGRGILDTFVALQNRLRDVRVCCGDWSRVLGPSPTHKLGVTGVFLDPPYSAAERDGNLYSVDSATVAADVQRWAVEHGDHPKLKIALCGYDGEHKMPPGWLEVPWKTAGGYGVQGQKRGRANAARERIWFSPTCVSSFDVGALS